MSKITLHCQTDNCKKSKTAWLSSFKANKYYMETGIYLCRTCSQKRMYASGERISYWKKYNEQTKGKTVEERLGEEKGKKLREIRSDNASGEKNPNFGGKYSKCEAARAVWIGKTWEEVMGDEASAKRKKEYSIMSSGERNPMFGKPAPQGSGNGWSGWYKDWYFRSLLELSYIYYLNRFKINWRCAESKDIKIQYVNWDGRNRNYFPNFIIDEKYIVEIKPKHLMNSAEIKPKLDAAKIWCKERGYIFKVIEPRKLSKQKIKQLYDCGDIVFIDRYKEKMERILK